MTKALITSGQHPGVYFLEKWLPQYHFIYGDASFIEQIPVSQQLLLPSVLQPDYIHQLLNICLDQQINIVFAMSAAEQELLAEATELFAEFDIQLHLPDLISRKLLYNLTELFQHISFNGIKTVSFQTTSSFAEFSKACLKLGYPTESIAVTSVQNPTLIWIVNDLLQPKTINGKPVIPFTKAARLFAADELLFLRTFRPSNQKTVYASFTGKKLVSAWNAAESVSEEILQQIGLQLELNGLFELSFEQEQLFNIQPFNVK